MACTESGPLAAFINSWPTLSAGKEINWIQLCKSSNILLHLDSSVSESCLGRILPAICKILLKLKRKVHTMASFTLQVLMLNSDLLPISDFFGCPFTRSFNCDPYPIHVFTLAIPSEASRMHCCHLAPPHVLPPVIKLHIRCFSPSVPQAFT